MEVVIASRFCGPPKSGNGGYVCGRVAAAISGTAAVRLKAPPPLETALRLEQAEGGAKLLHGDTVIAEGRPATLDIKPPPAPAFAEAEGAVSRYIGFKHHVFPRCFVCGPQRGVGDGLRIFPGSVGSGGLFAAPWVPDHDTVGAEFLWAALDCTSAFAVLPIPEGQAIVLGELVARIERRVSPGEKCIAAAWAIDIAGRKRIAGSTVYKASGEVAAVGRATWIEVPASAFGGNA